MSDSSLVSSVSVSTAICAAKAAVFTAISSDSSKSERLAKKVVFPSSTVRLVPSKVTAVISSSIAVNSASVTKVASKSTPTAPATGLVKVKVVPEI